MQEVIEVIKDNYELILMPISILIAEIIARKKGYKSAKELAQEKREKRLKKLELQHKKTEENFIKEELEIKDLKENRTC